MKKMLCLVLVGLLFTGGVLAEAQPDAQAAPMQLEELYERYMHLLRISVKSWHRHYVPPTDDIDDMLALFHITVEDGRVLWMEMEPDWGLKHTQEDDGLRFHCILAAFIMDIGEEKITWQMIIEAVGEKQMQLFTGAAEAVPVPLIPPYEYTYGVRENGTPVIIIKTID
ncbi:MAG: hypothetical protein ACOYI6_07470 [Christensenellales bacterium]|jgi:hypothetical protein